MRTNTDIRDMDLGMHDILDGRRLEVLADGLPLHGGAQLAIDHHGVTRPQERSRTEGSLLETWGSTEAGTKKERADLPVSRRRRASSAGGLRR